MNTAKSRMQQRIERHGQELITYFNLAISTDPVQLCKALRRIENRLHRAAEDYCNTGTDAAYDSAVSAAMPHIAKLLGDTRSILINADPRGYAVKIKNPNDFYLKDWGGYGIVAPDLTND